MGKLFALLFLISSIFMLSNSAFASSEEVFHQSNANRSSGWELDYGEDEELDDTESASEKKKDEKESEQSKSKKKEDFFKPSIDLYDKDLGSLNGRE